MTEQRILVLGANGQLGKALRAEFPVATFYGREECDLAQLEQVRRLPFEEFDVVINAAAYTAVDAAELDQGSALAEAVNATAVEELASAAIKHGFILVHISTDYVFDGTKGTPYLESDEFNPLSVYAKTKAKGDLAVKETPQHYILRTSWVIGEGNNFVKTMVSLAEKEIHPTVVNDQIGRLTFTIDLASAVNHLLKTKAPYGVYNLTNEGEPSSWADIAQMVYDLTGHETICVNGATTTEYFSGKQGIARRPLNSVLDLTKIKLTGFSPATWQERLEQYLSELN